MENKTLEQLLKEVPKIVASVRADNFDDARAQTIEDLACWSGNKHEYDLTADEHERLSYALGTEYSIKYSD